MRFQYEGPQKMIGSIWAAAAKSGSTIVQSGGYTIWEPHSS